ncbi:MAG: hypothetical protein R3B09_02305 [Nannocystaceae bacterium]
MGGSNLAPVQQLPAAGMLSRENLEDLRVLLCSAGGVQQLLRIAELMPRLVSRCESLESLVRRLKSRCDATDKMFERTVCSGQVLYSQRTLDEYSDDSQVNLTVVVQGLGAPYVNGFPVPPGQKIRLSHSPRPGFTPTKIAVDLNISGGGNNYLDFLLQLFLVPGGVSSATGLEVGSQMRANQFLNKDGTQIHVDFPTYRNCPIDVGSAEQLVLDITNTGAANNLDSAFITLYYDNRLFYALCRKACGCDDEC